VKESDKSERMGTKLTNRKTLHLKKDPPSIEKTTLLKKVKSEEN
jgi:hypothetical protein